LVDLRILLILKHGYAKRVADWPYRRFIATLSVAFIRWTGPMGLNPIWRLVNVLETHSAQYAKAIAPYAG
jgi:hypothetical protein